MNGRTVFNVDCSDVIPECGFNCPKGIEEIESTLVGIQAVSKAYIEEVEKEQKLVVEHDSDQVSAG